MATIDFVIEEVSSIDDDISEDSSLAPEDKTASDFVEAIVCRDDEIKEEEMKVFDMNGMGNILLVRQEGSLRALGTKCSHYGAPLEKGVLGDGRIRCPWHGACFNITTGDIEDFPGLDSLPCYKVEVKNNNVHVRANIEQLQANLRVKPMAEFISRDKRHFIIIGGGPSGAVCAETLRQEGFTGKITVLSKERYFPYDRIKIDKIMHIEMKTIQLRRKDFYLKNDINVMLNSPALGIDVNEQKVHLDDGSCLKYDSVFIATGNGAKKLEIPGCQLKNIFVIREYDDVKSLNNELNQNKHIVVVGSSFIAMESAAYLHDKAAKVTIISRDDVPFAKLFGKEIGEAILKLFTEKGVEFIPQSGVAEFLGSNTIESIKLVNGDTLKADICIVAIGTVCNTDFIRESGIIMNASTGTIEVNEYLQTNIPNVFAGGDIAFAPIYTANNTKAAIGHFAVSEYHGRMAAINMLGQQTPIKTVPFFWTAILGKNIRYAGFGNFDSVLYTGTPSSMAFTAYFLNNDKVVSVAACQMDPIVSQYAEYIAKGNILTRKDLAMEKDNLNAWIKKCSKKCF